MERINQFEFYGLGGTLKALDRFDGEVGRAAVFMHVLGANYAIQQLLNGKPIQLGVSRPSCQELDSAIKSLMEQYFYETDTDGSKSLRFPEQTDSPIRSWEWKAVKTALSNFETVFAAEMREGTSYFVPRKGIFHTAALVDSADESFPKELLPFLPEKTRNDWKAAGRCLAFNLLSASGFHVARAVEGTIEAYYQLFSGKPGDTLNSWNDYYKALEVIRKTAPTPSPSEKTLAEFVQMKDDYRNPIAHPRIVLTEPDARMLFNNGESLIIAMAQEIKTIRDSGIQPAFAIVKTGTGNS